MNFRWTIRRLLLGVNLFILLVPVGTILFLQVFDVFLLRQTERQLMIEAAVVGEAWRERLLDEMALTKDEVVEFRPPGRENQRFVQYEPRIGLGYELLPAAPDPAPQGPYPDPHSPSIRAAERTEPLMHRAQAFNLTGVRLLDRRGCVIATTGEDRGVCLDGLAEVREALDGDYGAVVRRRVIDGPAPPLTSIRRRSKLRVFNAVPVFMNGEVIGVVRLSRTSVSPLEMLWAHRKMVGLVAGVVLLFTPVTSYLFSHAISKPLRMLNRAANRMARGEPRQPFEPGPMAPQEVRTLTETLNRMTTQLTEKSEYILQFANNVSHELKTPLTGITGAVELLREEWEAMSDEQRRRFLDIVAADAERMERLVNGLLQLARIETVQEPTEEVEVRPFLESLVARYGSGVELSVTDPPHSIRINADHFETALRNLLDNAVRHSRDEPVRLTAATDDGRLLVSVHDRGPGIREGDRPRVFHRFFTTERDRGGTGLGLSIVKAIAETRGGSVDFDTSPAGTTFRLRL